MKREYDFSKGERGKFFRPDVEWTLQGGGRIVSARNWYKYDYKIGNRIKHSGITQDLEQREQQHQRRWPGGHIVQVGRATTEEAARDWEETKRKAITPKRK